MLILVASSCFIVDSSVILAHYSLCGLVLNFLLRADIFLISLFLSLRRRVVQVYERGARILDGSFMTQDLSFGPAPSESSSGSENAIVTSVSIADPYVVLRMSDGSIRLLVGGIFF